MERNEARAIVVRALSSVAPEVVVDDVDPGADVQDEFDLDSIDFLNVVTAVAGAIGSDVPERDYASLATLNGFVDYVMVHAEVVGR